MDFKAHIVEMLEKVGIKGAAILLEIPPDTALGDFALPCFTFAKEQRKAPPQIAAEIAKNIIPDDTITKVKATGPYVNFFLNEEKLVASAFAPVEFEKNDKTVVIECSSPNIAKPFGIGHLRSTVIGAALQRVYAFAGWKTVTVNHLGDWGTQFGKLIVAYKKWPIKLGEHPIRQLLDLYVKFHDEAEKDPSLEDAARAEFKNLEDGDEKNMKIWTTFRELSLKEFKRIYERMHVHIDHDTGESFYTDKMPAVIEELKKKGLLEESEGAQVVMFPDDKTISAPAIVVKSDGATMYITRDIATILYRKKTFNFDRILYEVGSEQTLHFKQLFSIVNKLGYDWYPSCFHVSHGLYRFPEGKMSTRKGKTVFIEEVFDQATSKTLSTIEEKNPSLKNKEDIAEQVGVGAIIFNDLKNDRSNDILFDWDEILDFEGESGPYLQYTHARLQSILRKSDKTPKVASQLLTSPEEIALCRHIMKFEGYINKIMDTNKPHTLARYLLDLAQIMNTFYQKHKVIQEDAELEQARLALVALTADRIQLGLELLGIAAPDEM